jgi:D-alanyl-D-alanine carboxypeptidase
MTRTLLCLYFVLCGVACAGDSPEQTPDPLQTSLDGLAQETLGRRDLVGLGIHVGLPDGRVYHTSAGSVASDGATPYDELATVQVVGSITKLYVATMILQLVEEGRLSLDDTTEAWVDVPDADQITIRMLLEHRSGLADYIDGMTAEDRARAWAPEELVARAVEMGAMPRDEYSRYSNTNFTVLTLVLEAVTGRSWTDNLHERITMPLGLEHTNEVTLATDPIAPGWVRVEGAWQSTLGLVDPSIGWGVGALTSTNAELFLFADSFFAGHLFADRATLDSMTSEVHQMDPATLGGLPPGTGIGLAVHRFEIEGTVLYGHMGHILGYDTAAFREPETGAVIVVTTNTEVTGAAALTAYEIAVHLRGL